MKSPQHLYRMKVEINASSRENSWPHSKRDVLADHQEQNIPFSLFFFFWSVIQVQWILFICPFLFPSVLAQRCLWEVRWRVWTSWAWWCLPSSLVWPYGSWVPREHCPSASSAPSVMHPAAGLLDHVVSGGRRNICSFKPDGLDSNSASTIPWLCDFWQVTFSVPVSSSIRWGQCCIPSELRLIPEPSWSHWKATKRQLSCGHSLAVGHLSFWDFSVIKCSPLDRWPKIVPAW